MTHFIAKTLPALTLALPLLCAAGAAQADVGNGNFGAGLTGWNPQGDVSALAGVMRLTTAFNTGSDAPFNLSGTPAIEADAMEASLELLPLSLGLEEEEAYEGAIARQSFAVAAGDTLSFQWSFSTAEDLFQDQAFVTLNGQVITLATRNTAPGGLQTFTRSFGSAGMVSLGFGVADTGDFLGVSRLNISNVQVTAVPEPASWALLLAGVAAVARRLRSHVKV